jgi:uncharacterized lipoprotein YmbA
VNRFYLRFALVWLVSVGVGCTSAPVRYYTLMPTPEKASLALETAPAIEVRVVHSPPQLKRSELMVRTGPTEVSILENEQWASPVNDEIKNALRLELQRRLTRMSGSRPTFTKLTLDIDVQQLEAEFGEYALLQASWSATLSTADPRSGGARVTNCTFQAKEKIGGGYAEIAEGYQRGIAALAGNIVGVLTSPASGSDPPCQKSIDGSAGASGSNGH